MRLHEIKGELPLIASVVSKLIDGGKTVKARVSISTIGGDELADAVVRAVSNDGWQLELIDPKYDDPARDPLLTDFLSDDDEQLELVKTDYGYLLRHRNPKKRIQV